MSEENPQIHLRRAKLATLRKAGCAFPSDFRRNALAADLHKEYDHALPDEAVRVRVAGRMMLQRVMGKAGFATVQDASGRIQQVIVVRKCPIELQHGEF